jgi:general nucleoside transport system permease protein
MLTSVYRRGDVGQTLRRVRIGRKPLTRAFVTLAVIVIGIPVLLRMLGFDPLVAMSALWSGSIGSAYALTSGTLVRATPLILTGLSVALAFRAGVFNIGAEGQLLVGAAAAAAIALAPRLPAGHLTTMLALLAGCIAGGLWAGVAAVLRARFHVLEVLSTILLNFVGVYLVSYLVRGPLQESLHIYPQSSTISVATRLPRFAGGSRLHAGFAIAVLVAVTTWWVLRHTAAGFRIRAAGANPDAAQSAGQIDVVRATTQAFLVSGAIAGLAGAIEVTGVTFALYENISPGYGYTGIAVALLARLDPLGTVASGLLFGALEAGAGAMQRDAGVPSVTVSIVEALIILGAVLVWPVVGDRDGTWSGEHHGHPDGVEAA